MITGYWPCRSGWFYTTRLHCGIVPDKKTAKRLYKHYTKEERALCQSAEASDTRS